MQYFFKILLYKQVRLVYLNYLLILEFYSLNLAKDEKH